MDVILRGWQVTTAALAFTYFFVKARKARLSRDCHDYTGTPADFLKIMNNTEFDKLKVRDKRRQNKDSVICNKYFWVFWCHLSTG